MLRILSLCLLVLGLASCASTPKDPPLPHATSPRGVELAEANPSTNTYLIRGLEITDTWKGAREGWVIVSANRWEGATSVPVPELIGKSSRPLWDNHWELTAKEEREAQDAQAAASKVELVEALREALRSPGSEK